MLFKRSDKNLLKIGDKTVYPRKITIAKWRQLFDSIQILPQLILSVISAPSDQRVAFAMVAVRESFDEAVRITSILTGIDVDYIDEHASIDELVSYYVEIAKLNNFGDMLKNVQGVLEKVTTKQATSQDAS